MRKRDRERLARRILAESVLIYVPKGAETPPCPPGYVDIPLRVREPLIMPASAVTRGRPR